MKIDKNKRVVLGFVIAVLCLLLIGCSQAQASQTTNHAATRPTIKPSPVLVCNDTNIACYSL